MKQKLDIFKVLGQANQKNAEYYSSLDEETRKQIQPLLIQRWLSGANNERQVIFLNEITNPFVFSLYKHPNLLWQLLTLTTPGKFQKCNWLSQKGASEKSKPVSTQVVMDYYKYNSRKAVDALHLLQYDQIIDLAEELGYQPDMIAKIKKEFNATSDGKRKTKSANTNTNDNLFSF